MRERSNRKKSGWVLWSIGGGFASLLLFVLVGFGCSLVVGREGAHAVGGIIGRFAPFACGSGALAAYFFRTSNKALGWSFFAGAAALTLVVLPALTIVPRALAGGESVGPPTDALILARGPDGTGVRHPSLGFELTLPPPFVADPEVTARLASGFGENAYAEGFSADGAVAVVTITGSIPLGDIDEFVRGTGDALRESGSDAHLERTGSGYDAEVRYHGSVQGLPLLARVVFVPTPGHDDQMTPVTVQIIGLEPHEARRITATLRERRRASRRGRRRLDRGNTRSRLAFIAHQTSSRRCARRGEQLRELR